MFDGANGILTEVARDDALMARIREAWKAFQPFLDRDVPPPLAEGDTWLRSDAAWSQAAEAYASAKQYADEGAKRLESA